MNEEMKDHSEIHRYDPRITANQKTGRIDYDGMAALPNGKWVLYTDYAALQQQLAAAREALVAAYDAGFMASGEGWNGEWGGDTDSAYYIEKRTENLATLQRDRQP